MRKIDTRDFRRATRSTPRQINRQIAPNLVREHEPISRADLARRMLIENAPIACALSQMWLGRRGEGTSDFVYVTV